MKSEYEHRDKERMCENCNGRGSIIIDATSTHQTQGFRQMECPECLGKGIIALRKRK